MFLFETYNCYPSLFWCYLFEGAVVWVAYDWRLALVIDDQGRILDQEEWTGKMEESRIIERLELLGAGGLTPESRLLSERWPNACVHMAGDPDLPEHEFPEMSVELMQALDEASRSGIF